MEWINLKAYGIKNAELIEKACGLEDADSIWTVLEKIAKFIENNPSSRNPTS